MKRKCENSELTDTQTKVRRIAQSMNREQVMKTREISTERELLSSQTNIMDLPPELMLEIFSQLSVRELDQCVAPVCKKWSILARHPSVRKDLSIDKDMSTSNTRELLRSSPLLLKLRLKDRNDTDAILRRVCRSNRRIETLEMEGCQGSPRRLEVSGRIVSRILDCCPKLSNLDVVGTEIRSHERYSLFARLHQKLFFELSRVSDDTMICYLRERILNKLEFIELSISHHDVIFSTMHVS
jgi:hypothetical protein